MPYGVEDYPSFMPIWLVFSREKGTVTGINELQEFLFSQSFDHWVVIITSCRFPFLTAVMKYAE